MIKNPLTDQEYLKCLSAVKALDPAKLTSSEILALRDIFYQSTYYRLCQEISIKLVEAEDEGFYPILIAKMRTLFSNRYLWTLMLRASSWDCSQDLDFFVDIMILRKDHCVILAKEIISEMEDIDEDDRNYAISKLTLYDQTIVHPEIKSAVKSVLNFLSKTTEI